MEGSIIREEEIPTR